ncbi:hypothetical protein CLAFUW4_11114 [Fulvia fulva]|uniref:S-adenosyl-L-methionine-dependent methyltransferase n=1 Tax=Passalora fulva TaxID=5499 RepID=A0A9Q8US61_PASFU|nr:uncharacterized protein CLAFUR5_10156 [Fulvia fulva]KAK4620003.1 hypothetical protein CLAFUR4_11119 [Fulvia fulva]KAK4620259.1 hypothetical protein CLAFUR0_11125 [Fulvia fulva]UJO20440.1 hypothetical protein CLAFUR5_10156 [Fulvia fulva]WPV17750.1 hypothetical protein CLAFUW4_11114 [Fulvia fulva]WPV32249.1 hypothetical protein CLAFUW7_11110 [Fulvia fulva]
MASAVSNLAASNNTRFNAEAAAWDSRPFVHEASQGAAKAIRDLLAARPGDKPVNKLEVLEIGCGTGILSFLLAPHVQRIIAVDAAEGMIDVLKEKLTKPHAPKNILPLALLLDNPEDAALPPADPLDVNASSGPRLKVDLITSHLVMHHIPDLVPLLETMYACLAPGGRVMLTDFEDFGPEAKRFHPASKMDGVARHGINARWMEAILLQVGFTDVEVEARWTMTKNVEKYEGEFGGAYGGDAQELTSTGKGEDMQFPFLVCYGAKN